MALIKNSYTVRQVAVSNQKACFICYRPSSTVLVEEAKRDFFYVCRSHLRDPGFATPNKGNTLQTKDTEPQKKKPSTEENATEESSEDALKDKTDDKNNKPKESSENSKQSENNVDAFKGSNAVPERTKSEQNLNGTMYGSYMLHKDIYALRERAVLNAFRHRQTMKLLTENGGLPSVPKKQLH
ncbi:fungal protein [Schizosaccharomyces japonicus yFS275]|uniref:Fungal protein n=1 Tax=Schizosaccharomyces japonicus (strain yFS275 / FY16936) TaxID=402676 RepID=B6JWK0_SCHJY|nr:fungal protein [Schizosaccharomyces japonicus yFS275]EEB05751.1 fungal protein [Schizosaccharomyces japonicus yFS275]